MEHQPFTWVSIIPGLNFLPSHTATSLIVLAIIVFFVLRAHGQRAAASDSAVPDDSLTFRNLAELLVEGVIGMAEGILGHNARKYVPLYGAFFIFILASNLMGLLPGFTPPTTNFNVTLALGLLSFTAYNIVGF
jgi:F-type H+-transporting ATPase subunit a